MARKPNTTDAEVRAVILQMQNDKKQVNPGALCAYFRGGQARRYKTIIEQMGDDERAKEEQAESLSKMRLPEELEQISSQFKDDFNDKFLTAFLKIYENALNIGNEKANGLEKQLREDRDVFVVSEEDFMAANSISESKLTILEAELVVLQVELEKKSSLIDSLEDTVANFTGQIECLTSNNRALQEQMLIEARPKTELADRKRKQHCHNLASKAKRARILTARDKMIRSHKT